MADLREKEKDFVKLTRLSSIGIAMILCTFIGYFIGHFLDTHLRSGPVFTIVFLIVGISAGFLNAFRTIAKDTE